MGEASSTFWNVGLSVRWWGRLIFMSLIRGVTLIAAPTSLMARGHVEGIVRLAHRYGEAAHASALHAYHG